MIQVFEIKIKFSFSHLIIKIIFMFNMFFNYFKNYNQIFVDLN
jgi:hypothetical protein